MNNYITRDELVKRWNCNRATIAYRQKIGDIKPIKLKGKCFYQINDIERLEIKRPINPRNQAAGKIGHLVKVNKHKTPRTLVEIIKAKIIKFLK